MTGSFNFEIVDAVDYEELRPGYAPEAVAWVVEQGRLRRESVVLDLAAGTGQLSRQLTGLDLEVVAVEPASNMRAILEDRVPSVRAVDVAAEALPFESGSVDGVVVGNAFHHFDRDAAFAELRRVLRPRGVLALFWAWPLEEEQRSIPGIEEIYEVVERAREASEIIAAYRSWSEPPDVEEGFEPFTRREFPHLHVLPSARLAALYATSSDVASLPEGVRNTLLERIRDIARHLPETLELPSRTVVDVTRKARLGSCGDRSI
ncbi:MAG TPA: class I SAM-dependent methyltransferase [Actinomycetota bacterium]|nr:class I SAM-dependent methyltransferase [Actinomycetota bacterium]